MRGAIRKAKRRRIDVWQPKTVPLTQIDLRGFDNLSGLDTPGANLLTAVSACGELHADRLKVRIEPTPSLVVRVRYIISKLRTFTAYVASLSHNNCLQ